VANRGPLKGQRHPYVYELVIALQHMGWRWIETYIWAKPNAVPGRFGPRTKDSFEYVYHFARGQACIQPRRGAGAIQGRLRRVRDESIRLGGIPLLAVLGGIGWARVNDTLGPVIRDTDGRVFTLANLPEMLTVAPFPTLVGLAPQVDAATADAGEQSAQNRARDGDLEGLRVGSARTHATAREQQAR